MINKKLIFETGSGLVKIGFDDRQNLPDWNLSAQKKNRQLPAKLLCC